MWMIGVTRHSQQLRILAYTSRTASSSCLLDLPDAESRFNNMAFGLQLAKKKKDFISETVGRTAKALGPDHMLERKPNALSGGQRQRVALGRAIVRSPKVFLFDEPLSNLDAKMRVQMRSEISKLHAQLGNTMIYVTHDQNWP